MSIVYKETLSKIKNCNPLKVRSLIQNEANLRYLYYFQTIGFSILRKRLIFMSVPLKSQIQFTYETDSATQQNQRFLVTVV